MVGSDFKIRCRGRKRQARLGAVKKGGIVGVGSVQLKFVHGRERKHVREVIEYLIYVRLSGASLCFYYLKVLITCSKAQHLEKPIANS